MFRLSLLATLAATALYGQNCVPTPILPAATVTGTLGGTPCALSDGTPYTSYRVALPVRGQAEFTLNPNPGGLNLMVQNAAGAQVAQGTAIQTPLEAGTYTLVVNLPALPITAPAAPPDYSFTLETAFTAEAGMLCSGFPALGLSQTAAGTVGTSGCALPDGTLYEAYTVSTFGAGSLTVTVASTAFTPLLIVRGADGTRLGSGAATVTVPVAADSQYQVVVATADTTGAFQVSTAFTPDPTESCVAQNALTAPGTDNNSLVATSCSAIVDGMGDEAYFNYYPITLATAGQVALVVTATDFAPALALLDGNGNTVSEDTGGTASGSAMNLYLPAGTYWVEVLSENATLGKYLLTYGYTAGAPTPCATSALTLGTAATGTLLQSSCRTQLGLADIYTLTLPASGTLALTLTTTNFTSQVALRDSKDNLIVLNQDTQGLGTSQLSANLPAGTHTVVASAITGAGGYQLTANVTAAAIAPCTFSQALPVNTGYIQNLGAVSCTGANGQPFDAYQFTLANDGTIAAVMLSDQFDAYLALTDSSGNVLRTDDNSYGFNDPLIVQFLPAGIYQLNARGASGNASGAYQIDLLASAGARPPFCAPVGTLAAGASINATLSFTACQYTDATFADVYQMTLAAAATIDLRMNSTDFDAYLVVLDAKGNLVAQDDDSGGGTNARVQQPLAAGTYYVYAKPFAYYYSTGNYTLTLAAQ